MQQAWYDEVILSVELLVDILTLEEQCSIIVRCLSNVEVAMNQLRAVALLPPLLEVLPPNAMLPERQTLRLLLANVIITEVNTVFHRINQCSATCQRVRKLLEDLQR